MPEDVLSKDAKLSEGDVADSELNTQAGEQPSPYDRWRNYQPASLARSESVDPLDLLSEPVLPIAAASDTTPPAPLELQETEGTSWRDRSWSANGTLGTEHPERTDRAPSVLKDSSIHSEPVSPAIEEPRHSSFVADDEIRAVYTGTLKSAAGDPALPRNEEETRPTGGLIPPEAAVGRQSGNPNWTTESAVSLPASQAPASLKSQAFDSESLNPDVLGTNWVNKDGIDVAPSRKLDTPDMLRWRAEMLLDEMMVGAVDSSAGEGVSSRRSMSFDEAAMLDDHPRRESRPENASPSAVEVAERSSASNAQNGDAQPANPDSAVSAGVRAALPPRAVTRIPTPIVRTAADVDSAGMNGHSTANGSAASNGSSHAYSPDHGNGNYTTGNGSNGHTGYTLESSEYAIADDGRPANGTFNVSSASSRESAGSVAPTNFVLASEQGSSAPDVSSPNNLVSADPLDHLGTYTPNAFSSATTPPVVETRRVPTRTNGAPAAPAQPASTVPAPARMPSPLSSPSGEDRYVASGQRTEAEQTTRKLTAVEKRYPRSASGDGQGKQANQASAADIAARGAHNDALDLSREAYAGGLGPVRINPAVINSSSITGAMSVGSRVGSRYASLLPRATPWDLHEMEREIVSLQEEMARVLPSGHETSRRAHHLLEKAQSIFSGDPLRSAEVDYYLTQVRAIVQRSRQTMQWSELYRHQLGRYHLAWIVLSTLMLVLGLAFGDRLSSWAVALFGLNPNGMIGAYVVPAVIAMFAGSLGASIGAVLNIRRYHRLNLGYFDRKYSLRGLMLPIIGLLGGVIFFALFGSIYWAMGTESPLPIGLELLPAILAFALGFLQESIYGTRD